jgi:hypothetical protein
MTANKAVTQPDDTVANMLRRAVERHRAQTASEIVTVEPLQPALQRRLEQRMRGNLGGVWLVGAKEAKRDPLEYMQLCRKYLAKLDTLGWDRSYHQRLFHDDFLKACTRSFWKLEPPGQFARDHQKVLRTNSWDHIAQEILISTPRRFGKTISVSMFCAAMLLACPGVEISIYSTCKRISQKILRNVQKFALLIADSDYETLNFSVKRQNMEEINLQGPLGNIDVRIINSYPSKVKIISTQCKSLKCPSFIILARVKSLRCHSRQFSLREKHDWHLIITRKYLQHSANQARQRAAVIFDSVTEKGQQKEQITLFTAAVSYLVACFSALLDMDVRPT